MTVVANLTVAGITRGKYYDVIDKSDRFIKIVLDNGKIGVPKENYRLMERNH